jgi:hypothetical protein
MSHVYLYVYLWRVAAGVALGFYGTWISAAIVTAVIFLYHIPLMVSSVRQGEVGGLVGLYLASKAASFLVPLWLTIMVLDGGFLISDLSDYFGISMGNLFIRSH